MTPAWQRSSWLTASRYEQVLRGLPVVSGGQPANDLKESCKRVWTAGGGNPDETRDLLLWLQHCRLARVTPSAVVRTRLGNRIVKQLRTGRSGLLALHLIRCGYFHDQVRRLVEVSSMREGERLACELTLARGAAPQLLGVLSRSAGVERATSVAFPEEITEALTAVWSIVPPESKVPGWAQRRKAVGDRAEMYSVQYERDLTEDRARVRWVAQDSDSLGWDVENRAAEPMRRIEVKGSIDTEVRFFLSKNEMDQATRFGVSYEVQFWGGLDLSRPPEEEYRELVSRGYPLVYVDPAQLIMEERLRAAPVRWRIDLPAADEGVVAEH